VRRKTLELMVESIWRLIVILLFLACFTSFAWAMKNFFVKPSGNVAGMTMIKLSGIAFVLLHLYYLLHPPLLLFGLWQLYTAALVYLCSLALFWWALNTNRSKPLSAVFSPDDPVHVVQQGPYRMIRHPFYTSYLLSWIAGVFATGQSWLVLTVAVMIVLYYRAARYEERKFAASALGESYRSYRSRTGLFLPSPIKMMHTLRGRGQTG
jgi:protein-S-isoprenylcysteine O-methyltransferase Ste14